MFVIETNEGYFLHLIACALDGRTPKPLPPSVAPAALYRLAERHGVRALTYTAYARVPNVPSDALLAAWKESYQRAVVRDATQQYEFEQLSAMFTRCKQPFVPLKGLRVKAEYPATALREMGDLDILLPKADFHAIRPQMEALGYTFKERHALHHDIYLKPPIMNIELHREVHTEDRHSARYFAALSEAAAQGAGCVLQSDEDLYLHLVLHAAEHVKDAGMGIRLFLDLYLFRKHHTLDDAKVAARLSEWKLASLEHWMLLLSALWFDETPPVLSAEDAKKADALEAFFLQSSLYGSAAQQQTNAALKAGDKRNSLFLGKVRNFLSATFLPYKLMCLRYPILKKAPVLLPIFWVVRIVDTLLHHRNRLAHVATELDAVDPAAFQQSKQVLDTLFR